MSTTKKVMITYIFCTKTGAGGSGLHDTCVGKPAVSTGSTASEKYNSAGCYSPAFAPSQVDLPAGQRLVHYEGAIIRFRAAAPLVESTLSTAS